MNWKLYILFIAVVGVVLLSRTSIGSLPVIVYIVAALVFAIPFFFGARRRSETPTATETVLATLWLWLRRLLCWFMALGLAIVGIALLLTFDPSIDIIVSIGVPILMLLAALFLGFIGWFGMPTDGGRRFTDYIRSYQENKQRYKWKW